MRDLGQSSAADPALSTSLEDQSRLAFESGGIQMHQVLAVKPGGSVDLPLRPWWIP